MAYVKNSATRLYDIVGCFRIKAPSLWSVEDQSWKSIYTFLGNRQTNKHSSAVALPPPLAEVIKVSCLQSAWFREGILFQFFVTENERPKKKPITKAKTTKSIDFWMTKPSFSNVEMLAHLAVCCALMSMWGVTCFFPGTKTVIQLNY